VSPARELSCCLFTSRSDRKDLLPTNCLVLQLLLYSTCASTVWPYQVAFYCRLCLVLLLRIPPLSQSAIMLNHLFAGVQNSRRLELGRTLLLGCSRSSCLSRKYHRHSAPTVIKSRTRNGKELAVTGLQNLLSMKTLRSTSWKIDPYRLNSLLPER
jgi:hypothetical protein